ncbi:unnamed protein product, partial [Meganyctiphanes norvegica]
SQCEKAFLDNSALIKHKRTHTGEKPYQCSYCEKAYARNSRLIIHLKTHTGGIPYVNNDLKIKDKQIADSWMKVYGKRIHDEDKGKYTTRDIGMIQDVEINSEHGDNYYDIEPVQSQDVEVILKEKNETNDKEETGICEKPYQCNECDKAFTIKQHLWIHQRTHTGDKPYHCSQCDKAFSVKQNLVRHYRTHTGDKPFKCTHCVKSFSQNSHLLN